MGHGLHSLNDKKTNKGPTSSRRNSPLPNNFTFHLPLWCSFMQDKHNHKPNKSCVVLFSPIALLLNLLSRAAILNWESIVFSLIAQLAPWWQSCDPTHVQMGCGRGNVTMWYFGSTAFLDVWHTVYIYQDVVGGQLMPSSFRWGIQMWGVKIHHLLLVN